MHPNDKKFFGRTVRFANKRAAIKGLAKFTGKCAVISVKSGEFDVPAMHGAFLLVDVGKSLKVADQVLQKLDMFYYGMVSYGGYLMVWKKSETVPPELYNPPIVVTQVMTGEKIINVVRDDYLISGTKQRAVVPLLMQHFGGDKVGYAGPIFGYAQIALAYACKLLKKQAYVFVEKQPKLHPFTAYAKSMGAKIIEFGHRKNTPLKVVQSKATAFSKKNDVQLLPFGLHHPEYIKLLEENLRKVIDFHPKRMWCVAGSAVILNVLAALMPATHFCVVQVGKKVWPDQLPEGRSTFYIAPEKFWDPSIRPPPYPSVSNYDGKLWQFVEQFGEDGDYVWNVGKDI